MKKSMLSMLLVMTMLLALLAGCGNQSQQAIPEGDEAPEASLDAPADEIQAPPDGDPAGDENGRPVIEYPLVDEPATLTYLQAWPTFLSAISEPQDAAMFEALEDATGVRLEMVVINTETAADNFMLRCSSGDLTDMVQNGAWMYTGGGAKAIEDEVLIDLLPLLEEYSNSYYSIMTSDPNIYKNILNDEGQVPALLGMYTDYFYTDQAFWIRQDILDAVGKEMPTTVAELDDVLAAFKDYGLTDGLIVLSQGKCDLLARAYDANNKQVDGEVMYMGTSENYKSFLKKMHEYYEKGYISKDFVTYTDSDTKPPQDVVLSGMGGMFNEDVSTIAGYCMNSDNPNFDLQPVPQIRLEEGAESNNGYNGVKVADRFQLSISTQCENPKLAIQYMDYLFSDEGFLLANYGIEGDTYTVENGEYKFTDKILNNEQFDWQMCQSLFINPGFPCLTDLSIAEMTYTEAQKKAVDVWVGAFDSSDESLPNEGWLTYTTEESEIRAGIESDIETYQLEMQLKFITGQLNIDAEWDNYVKQLEAMGYLTLEEIDQAAYDRYLAK